MDRAIWAAAIELGAVIITKDRDFVQLGTGRDDGPPVVWIRLANTRREALLAWFETMLPDLLAALQRGELLIELA